jgi:feruloyl esterase
MTDTALADAASARQLTVIITTSPTPSAPSTELLSSVLSSFRAHCPELLNCPVIVVFDTYDHITSVAKFKRAQVTQADAEVYVAYKENVKDLIIGEHVAQTAGQERTFTSLDGVAEFGSPLMETSLTSVDFTVTRSSDHCITFIEPRMRLGFALAVRTALRIATTPYVWIQQHDWRLATNVPLRPMLALMQEAHNGPNGHKWPPIEYVTFVSTRWKQYAASMLTSEHPAFRRLTTQLKQDFEVVLPSKKKEDAAQTVKVPMTPLFMWLDKPHLASREHYLNRIFPTRLAVSRGDFIEDTIGQRARAQMKGGNWERWATWMYYPGEGETLCLHHLQGRTFRGEEGEKRMAQMWREKNKKERTASASPLRLEDQAIDAALTDAKDDSHGTRRRQGGPADKTDAGGLLSSGGLEAGRADDLDLPT